MGDVCFVDTETTALDRAVRQVWEVALITAGGDEYLWNLPVDLARANPMSLGMNGFHERYEHWDTPEDKQSSILWAFAREFASLTRGLHLVGACVNFDEVSLWDLLRNNGECPMWHYHIIDVEALAAGWLAGRRHASDYAARTSETVDCTYTAINTEDGPESRCRIHPWTDHEFSSDPTGALPPWKSVDLSRAVGVEPKDFEKHTALGDARWAKAIYEAVMGR